MQTLQPERGVGDCRSGAPGVERRIGSFRV